MCANSKLFFVKFCRRARIYIVGLGAISTKDLDGWIFCKIRRAWVKLWWASVKKWILASSISSQCFSCDVANQEVVWLLPGSVRILTEELQLLHQKQNTGSSEWGRSLNTNQTGKIGLQLLSSSQKMLTFPNTGHSNSQECVLCCLLNRSNFEMSSSRVSVPKEKLDRPRVRPLHCMEGGHDFWPSVL